MASCPSFLGDAGLRLAAVGSFTVRIEKRSVKANAKIRQTGLLEAEPKKVSFVTSSGDSMAMAATLDGVVLPSFALAAIVGRRGTASCSSFCVVGLSALVDRGPEPLSIYVFRFALALATSGVITAVIRRVVGSSHSTTAAIFGDLAILLVVSRCTNGFSSVSKATTREATRPAKADFIAKAKLLATVETSVLVNA